MRLRGIIALALLVILDVFLVVALEIKHLRVALEGEDMRRDTVQKPAVVRDDHGATGKRDQRVFERAQRFDIQIVGRFVEQPPDSSPIICPCCTPLKLKRPT